MTTPEVIYHRALREGFTTEAACSLLANIQAESAFSPTNAEDRINRVISDEDYIYRADSDLPTYDGKNFIYDAVGFGYIQWTYWSRKKRLLEYCKARGTSVSSHDSQLAFIFIEMKEDYYSTWKLCTESHDIEELIHQLVWVWENPADKQSAYNTRLGYAKAWYAKFNNWSSDTDNSQINNDAKNEEPVDEDGMPMERTWPPRTIQKDLNWPETYLAQSLLRCHGYNILICGVFADSMERKIKEFQTDNNLKADGIIGPLTWKALLKLPSNY